MRPLQRFEQEQLLLSALGRLLHRQRILFLARATIRSVPSGKSR
jgi:hypothetical protein